MGKRKTISIEDYRSRSMASSKALKRKQSNLHLSDESMQQTPNGITRTQVGGHSSFVPDQANISHHDKFTQQNNSSVNETSPQPQSMTSKALKGKQRNLHLSGHPMQQTPNVLTRSRVGGRVYNRVLPDQANYSRHDELTQQKNTSINEPSQQPPSMVNKTPIFEQRNSSLLTKPNRFSDRQVSNKVMDNQQIPYQVGHVNDLELNDELGGCSNTQQEHPRQQSTHEFSNGINEVENAENSDEEIEQKVRGPTYMLKIWGRPSSLPLIEVDFDDYGRPIGPNKSKFTEFLGTIARNGIYCPIDVENWHKMSKEYKTNMISAIKTKFDITLADEDWILHSINAKWRSWKAFLKARCFMPNKTVEFLMDEKEERVLEDQWVNMVNYWNREDVQAESDKKREARLNKRLDHRTGKKSFAEIHANMSKEKGRAPFHSEMFEVCYTPANGSPSIEVSKYLASMKELRNQLPEGSNDIVGPSDIFAQVTGSDKPGYVRMFGGVPSSDLWGEVPGRNSYKRKVLEQQSEIYNLKNQMADLQSRVSSQQIFMSQQPQGSTPLPESPPQLVLKK